MISCLRCCARFKLAYVTVLQESAARMGKLNVPSAPFMRIGQGIADSAQKQVLRSEINVGVRSYVRKSRNYWYVLRTSEADLVGTTAVFGIVVIVFLSAESEGRLKDPPPTRLPPDSPFRVKTRPVVRVLDGRSSTSSGRSLRLACSGTKINNGGFTTAAGRRYPACFRWCLSWMVWAMISRARLR